MVLASWGHQQKQGLLQQVLSWWNRNLVDSLSDIMGSSMMQAHKHSAAYILFAQLSAIDVKLAMCKKSSLRFWRQQMRSEQEQRALLLGARTLLSHVRSRALAQVWVQTSVCLWHWYAQMERDVLSESVHRLSVKLHETRCARESTMLNGKAARDQLEAQVIMLKP